MATLVQAADVEAVRARNQRVLHVAEGALVTPLAAERARDLGVRLVRPGEEGGAAAMCLPGDGCDRAGGACGTAAIGPAAVSEAQLRRVVSAVILQQMPEAFSPLLVRQVTQQVLERLAGG